MQAVILHHVCPNCHYETHEVMDVLNDGNSKRYSFRKELDGKRQFYRINGVGCVRCPYCGIVSTFEDAETEEEYNE